MINVDDETGISYGYIDARCLHDDLVDDLLGIHFHTILLLNRVLDPLPDDWNDNYDAEEIEVIGILDGVEYASSWLDGVLNFFIIKSPHVTHKAGRASPCVLNAGILDELDGDVTAYDVPPDWRVENGE